MRTLPELDFAFSESVTGLTGLLADRHDGLTVVRAVTSAYGQVLSANASGVLVRDPRGGVVVLASSDERTHFVELLQAHAEEGPCVQCIVDNAVVSVPDLSAEPRWPQFRAAAAEAGFAAVHGFPLRLGGEAIGGVNVLYNTPTTLSGHALGQGQALADFAVLGLTQERDPRRAQRLAEATLGTLNDRTRVNQAVGMVAGVLDLAPQEARAVLNAFSVRTGRSLRDLAEAITDGSLPAEDVS